MFIIFGRHFSISQLFCVLATIFATACFIVAFLCNRQQADRILGSLYFLLVSVVLFLPVAGGRRGQFNLTFKAISLYNIKHIIQNIVLFVPLAFFIAQISKKPLFVAFVTIGFSIVTEVIQLFICGRVADITDVAANAVGSMFGALLAFIVHSYVYRRKNEVSTKGSMLP